MAEKAPFTPEPGWRRIEVDGGPHCGRLKRTETMTIAYGHKVKPEKAEKMLAKFASELVPGEEVWFYGKCTNLRPSVDALVVTNGRVLGLGGFDGYKFRVPHADIAEVSGDTRRGRITVRTGDGTEMVFKQVALEDVPVALHYIEYGRACDLPADVAGALTAQMSAPPLTARDVSAQKLATKEAAKAQKLATKEAAKEEAEARDRALAGREVAKGSFDGQTIRIYERGYVRLSALFSGGPLERLKRIEASAEITKKTGVGRAVGLAASGGLSMFSPNRRGDIYLTITTDRTTHVLHQDPPSDSAMKTARRLEAAGKAVLDAAARASVPTTTQSSPRSRPSVVSEPEQVAPATGVAQRLQQLEALRVAGLVTDEEYEQKRAQILDAL
jgi:hypothetical protein